MARFTRTFASLISSGLPLVGALETAGQTIGNSVYELEINKIASDVKSGIALSDTFKKSVIIPKMVGQLASVGEKSGNVDQVFNTLADFFDRDVDNITTNLSTMLEPILMVVMGTAIGIVIISILQPIYGMVNAI
jgi:type IV pilus assembly protein PilC